MKCLSIPTDPNQKESKYEQAGGTEQGPLGLSWGGTLGHERETGKNKATAPGLELTDKGSGAAAKQIPLIKTGANSPSAFCLHRTRIQIAKYRVPDSLYCPPGTKNGPWTQAENWRSWTLREKST